MAVWYVNQRAKKYVGNGDEGVHSDTHSACDCCCCFQALVSTKLRRWSRAGSKLLTFFMTASWANQSGACISSHRATLVTSYTAWAMYGVTWFMQQHQRWSDGRSVVHVRGRLYVQDWSSMCVLLWEVQAWVMALRSAVIIAFVSHPWWCRAFMAEKSVLVEHKEMHMLRLVPLVIRHRNSVLKFCVWHWMYFIVLVTHLWRTPYWFYWSEVYDNWWCR